MDSSMALLFLGFAEGFFDGLTDGFDVNTNGFTVTYKQLSFLKLILHS